MDQEKNEELKDEEIKTEETKTEEELPAEENETEEQGEPEAEDELESLKKENEKLTEQVAVLKNEYARAYADTENTRRRLNNEFEQLSKYKAQDFAKLVLPVMDDLERALSAESSDEALHKGVEMAYGKLKAALEKEGVKEIECLNQPFDANWHQAVMTEAVDGVESGIVTAVLQKGYMIKDRLLRAAMVKVSE